MTSRVRRLALGLILTAGLAAQAGIQPPSADAASCVRIVSGTFDAPGNDHYNLNGEFVRFKNVCATSKLLTGWNVHDYGRKHTFAIPSGFRIGAGVTVTLFSGSGTRTATKLFWRRPYGSGAVWNNTGTERAYLRNGSGTVVSSWSSR